MAKRVGGRRRGRPPRVRHDSDGSGSVDTGLPVLPPDVQRCDGDTDLWLEIGLAEQHPFRGSDAGDSTDEDPARDQDEALHSDGGGLRAGDDGDGEDRDGIGEGRVSSSQIIDDTQFPDVPDGHWNEVEKAVTVITEAGIRDLAGIRDNGEALNVVIGKSLRVVDRILDEDPDSYDKPEDRLRCLAILNQTSANMLTAGLKADENRFRKENHDVIHRLFEKITSAPGKIYDPTSSPPPPSGQ